MSGFLVFCGMCETVAHTISIVSNSEAIRAKETQRARGGTCDIYSWKNMRKQHKPQYKTLTLATPNAPFDTQLSRTLNFF